MAKLTWDPLNDRHYESGISRVVFYPVSGTIGYAWSGVTKIEETTPQNTVSEHFHDGVKYLDFPSSTVYEAKLTALTVPNEFRAMLGEPAVCPGYQISGQRRPRFHMCYRTETNNGNYKLHFLYNVLATPAGKGYKTLSASPTAAETVIQLTTTPVDTPGFKATAHISVDSRLINLSGFEYILYGADGSPGSAPRMIMPNEFVGV